MEQSNNRQSFSSAFWLSQHSGRSVSWRQWREQTPPLSTRWEYVARVGKPKNISSNPTNLPLYSCGKMSSKHRQIYPGIYCNVICNYIHYNVWDEITYPFSNFNDATMEVRAWINNFISHFTEHMIAYPCWGYSQSTLVKGTRGSIRSSLAKYWPCKFSWVVCP